MKINWFSFKINWLLMLFIFVCKVNQAQVPEEKFSKLLKGNNVQVGSVLDVKDDKLGNSSEWSTITDNYYSEGVLIFEINPDTTFFIPDSFTCTIDVVDTIFDASNTKTIIMESLTINYDTLANKPYKNKAVIFYHSAHRIRTQILGIHYHQGNGNAVPPNIFRLRSEIQLSRSYQFDCNAGIISHSIYYDANSDRVIFTWGNIPGATDYDLEWTFYDDSSTVVKNIANLNFDSLFTHNATRITTKDISYYISPIFQSGYIFYRIRGVKTLPNFERMTTIWSKNDGNYQHIDWHNQTMNWQYNVSFAEGGKKKEVVNYMDGSLRSRQSVTRANTLDISIVGETIYDYQGRPAVTVLPVPTFDPKIKHFNSFNIGRSGQEYNYTNFDVGACGIIPDSMKNSSGASNYYSSNNPDKLMSPDKYLPDAGGYPFSVTEYTPDLTGRINRQSGVGPDFKLGTNHETKYFYGKPAQGELDRLFGNDAGFASHYTEEMVIDPNQQISVTYKDAHDRVVATALAGKVPDNLQQLPDFRAGDTVRADFLDNNHRINQSLVSSYSLLAKSIGLYHFEYNLYPDFYKALNCNNDSICYDCLYNIHITINDICGQPVTGPSGTKNIIDYKNYSLPSPFDTLCSTASLSVTDTFSLNLNPGSYIITREVTVSDSGIAFYKQKFIRENTCKTFNSFLDAELGLIDYSGCNMTCEKCLTQLGVKDTFVNHFLANIAIGGYIPTPADTVQARTLYDEAKSKCNELCFPVDVCNIKKEAMKSDLYPGGQYALYGTLDTDPSIDIPSTDPTSIFYFNNNRFNYQDPSILPYLDADGNTIYVEIDGVTLTPDQIPTINKFIDKFEDSWTETLLKLHPEYCYLQFCENNSASHLYDGKMLDTDSYQTALDSGYLNPLNTACPIPGMGLCVSAHPDPFFQTGGGGAALSSAMNSAMSIYNHPTTSCSAVTLSIWQVAILGGTEGSPTYDVCTNTPPLNINNLCNGDKNQFWRMFRALYLQLKDQKYAQQESAFVLTGNCSGIKSCNTCIGGNLTQYKMMNHSTTPTCGTKFCNSYYFDKVPHFYHVIPGSTLAWTNQNTGTAWVNEQKDSICKSNCEGYRPYWQEKLKDCNNIDTSQMRILLDYFQSICQEGCDFNHPLGSSSVPPASTFSPGTFEQAMQLVLGVSANNPYCNSTLIDIPRPYNNPPFTGNLPIFPKPPACTCDKLDSLLILYRTSTGKTSIDSFAVYLKQTFGSELTVSQITEIQLHCHDTLCRHLSEPIAIPDVLACNTCLTCDSINYAYLDFLQMYPTGMNTPNIELLLTGYYNQRFGFSLDYDEYISFMDTCAVIHNTIGTFPSCDTLNKLLTNYLASTPTQTLEVYFNSHLSLNYTYTDYSTMLYHCAFDTLYKDYITCDSLSKRFYEYNALSTTVSFTHWIDSVFNLNYSQNQVSIWLMHCGLDTSCYCTSLPTSASDWDILNVTLGSLNNNSACGELGSGPRSKVSKYSNYTTGRVSISVPSLNINSSNSFSVKVGSCSGGSSNTRFSIFIDFNHDCAFDVSERVYASSTFSATPTGAVVTGIFSIPNTATNGITRMRVIDTDNSEIPVGCGSYSKGETEDYNINIIPALTSGTSCATPVNLSSTPGATFATLSWNASAGSDSYKIYYRKVCDTAAVTSLPVFSTLYNVSGLTSATSYEWWVQSNCSNGAASTFSTKASFMTSGTCNTLSISCDSLQKLVDQNAGPKLEARLNSKLVPKTHAEWTALFNCCCIHPNYYPSCDTLLTLYLYLFPNGSKHLLYCDSLAYFVQYNFPQLTFSQAHDALVSCGFTCDTARPAPMLCNRSMFPEFPLDTSTTDGCMDDMLHIAYNNALHNYDLYKDSIRSEFSQSYVNHCLNKAKEKFYANCPISEYHYTLYYYDQAGNLVKTVPPKGVIPIYNKSILGQVDTFRVKGSGAVRYQSYSFGTTYYYNTLNQLSEQNTPDAGQSKFWYDRVGRLVVSQNSEQKLHNYFSYTLYDDLGRIKQVGRLTQSISMTDARSRDPIQLATWISGDSIREQVTQTFYDRKVFNVSPGFIQSNLRSRVASVTYEDVYDGDSVTYKTASHYNYDIEGNVTSLIQENRNLFNIGRNLKRIDYTFDLISGKVNEVFYQRDSIDQFLHKYEYDADNRITDVLTSRDGLIWDHDGRYKYYKHGPLARLEIGEQQVQGVDYAYTLQGWLKGINSSSRDSSRDMGSDAVPVSGQAGVFAKDAYAMTLGYFHDDFKPIGGNEFEADYTEKPFGNDSYHNSNTGYDDLGLYNGNIRHSVVSLGKMNYQHMGYVYRYDQLNRYTAMDAYNDFDNANNRWGNISSISEYKENVSYDPNGNITYYKRNGSGGSPFTNDMDILNYAYVPNTNKLKHVQDAVDASYYANDIDNQTRFGVNYRYDSTGNMVTDSAEHLHIYWNNYGKLDSTFNWNSGVAMKFIYDPSSNRVEKRFYSVPGNYSKRTNTYYIRDAQGNILANYVFKNDDTLSLTELDIYGSSRLGVLNEDIILYDAQNVCNGCKSFVPSPLATYWLGKKQYELTNHLGNVLTTITDKKIPVDINGNGVADYYLAEISSQNDYYPFGMTMPGRSYNTNSYRFGYNKGSEKDDEISGSGNHFTTFYREGDTRLATWWSPDPEADEQPYQSPYSYMDGNPILLNDPNGDCPWCIGAIVGAALDAGLQLTEIALDDSKSLSDFSFTSVGVSAAAGAIGVGIATKIDKVLKVANLASKVTTAAIKVTTSAATDAATSAASQKITKGKVNAGEVLVDVVAGGLAGKVAGDVAKKIAKNSPVGKVLVKQADRAERVAGSNPRPTRAAAAKTAQQKSENYAAKRGAAAGTAASGAASGAATKVIGTESKKKEE